MWEINVVFLIYHHFPPHTQLLFIYFWVRKRYRVPDAIWMELAGHIIKVLDGKRRLSNDQIALKKTEYVIACIRILFI